MSDLIHTSPKQTMTSRQIAEAVGSDHHNVLATVRRLIKEGVISGNETPYIHEQNGQQYTEFRLDYRDTMVVASGYSAELRARIIDLWLLLESEKPAFRLPQTFSEALHLAAEQAERIERQAAELALAAPKVAFAEAIRAIDGVCKIGDVGKTLGIGRTKLFRRLKDDKILMKNNLPYQKWADKGYFTVVENEPYTNSKGETHPTFTTMVTGAGQVFLAKRYATQHEEKK